MQRFNLIFVFLILTSFSLKAQTLYTEFSQELTDVNNPRKVYSATPLPGNKKVYDVKYCGGPDGQLLTEEVLVNDTEETTLLSLVVTKEPETIGDYLCWNKYKGIKIHITSVKTEFNEANVEAWQYTPSTNKYDVPIKKKLKYASKEDNLKISDRDYIFQKKSFFQKLTFDIAFVPFKIRPASNGRPFQTSGEFTFGVVINGFNSSSTVYKPEGNIVRSFKLGLLTAATLEKLEKSNRRGGDDEDTDYTQLYFTTGLAISGARNGWTLSLIPFAFDLSLSPSGKDWVYANRVWYGLGISTDVKTLTRFVSASKD